MSNRHVDIKRVDCVGCGRLVPDADVAPYPLHAPDCALVAEWMAEQGLVDEMAYALRESAGMLENQFRQALGFMSREAKDRECSEHKVLKMARAALAKYDESR